MMLVKFIFNIMEDKIVSTYSLSCMAPHAGTSDEV